MKQSTRIGIMAGLILGSLLLQNCSSSDDPAPKTEIYLAGLVDDGKPNYSVAFTKNGALTVLGDGTVSEYTLDCTLDGNDLYFAGASNNEPAYWKNGVFTHVEKDSDLPWEEYVKVIVKNGKKYFLAYGPAESNAYRYYADGVKTILPSQALASDMAVAKNGDVYVVGKSLSNRAVYWKNGVMSELSTEDSGAAGIVITGSDVYITGYYINEESAPVPVVWKNGVLTEIGEGGAYPNHIAVSGSDVYVIGRLTNDSPVLWKNGEMTPIGVAGHTPYNLYGLEIKNDDVYILGEDNATGKSLLFKNGALVAPFDGTMAGQFGSMAVK